MIPKPLAMLRKLHAIFKNNEGLDDIQAFERLLEWIAVQISTQIGVSTEWMKEETSRLLHEHFRLSELSEFPQDWLGDFYHALIGKPYDINHVSDSFAAGKARIDWDPKQPAPPKTLCFQKCGTGIDILSTFRFAGDSVVYYGLEPDVILYRIALVNMTIHNVPAHILCADYDVIEPFHGSNNWRFSNLWDPVDLQEFKLRPNHEILPDNKIIV